MTNSGQLLDNITWRIVDNEALIVNTETGAYYSLNSYASEIWVALTEGKQLAEILELLSETYDMDSSEARAGVEECIQLLQSEALWR